MVTINDFFTISYRPTKITCDDSLGEGIISVDENTVNIFNVQYTGGSFLANGFSSFISNAEEIDFRGFSLGDSVTSLANMFQNATNLKTIDLSSLDTMNITDMSSMFNGCSSLEAIDLSSSSFHTNDVTNMSYMFSDCSSLKTIDLSSLDTSSLTNISHMFSGCSGLKTIDLSLFNFSSIYNMEYLFSNCSNLEKIVFPSSIIFDSSPSIYFNSIFYNTSSLKSINLSNIYLANIGNFGSAFEGCGAEEIILDNWQIQTTNVSGESQNFIDGLSNLKKLRATNWTLYDGSFANFVSDCENLSFVDFSGWTFCSTNNINLMHHMISDCNKITSINMSKWSIPSDFLTIQAPLITNCENLASVDFSDWTFNSNGSSINIQESLIDGCGNIESLDLSSWGQKALFHNSYLFGSSSSLSKLKSINLANLRPRSNYIEAVYIIRDNKAISTLTDINLSYWDTSSMEYPLKSFFEQRIFNIAPNLEKLDLTGWDSSTLIARNYYSEAFSAANGDLKVAISKDLWDHESTMMEAMACPFDQYYTRSVGVRTKDFITDGGTSLNDLSIRLNNLTFTINEDDDSLVITHDGGHQWIISA